MGIGRSEGGPRWRRRVFELVSNSGTTVVWPALETNVVSKQKKVQCWIVHLAERCSVRTRRALRVAPPLPTWQFFIIDNDIEIHNDQLSIEGGTLAQGPPKIRPNN